MEYAIIPISFRDYNEYVDSMNELSKEGWILVQMIRIYEDSPIEGVTTHDWVCRKSSDIIMA